MNGGENNGDNTQEPGPVHTDENGDPVEPKTDETIETTPDSDAA
jgi:hypothetical protein